MKTGTLLLSLLLFCYLGNTQILFEHDFSIDTIAPMTAVDNDGFTVRSSLQGIGDSWSAGNGRVFSAASFIPTNKADNWLITPAIPIMESNTILRWQGSRGLFGTPESYKVLVSTSTSDLAQFTEELVSIEEEGLRINHALKLDAFIGDTIYIAFVHTTFDGFFLSLDDISVAVEETTSSTSVSMRAYVYPFYKGDNPTMNIKVVIDNYSSLDIVNGQLGVTSKATDSNILQIDNVGEYKQIETSFVYNDLSDKDEVRFHLKSANGEIIGETPPLTIYGLQNPPKKRFLIEENSATWCGGCPMASVFFEKMKLNYAEDYVGIAVHEMDTMSLQTAHTTDFYRTHIFGIPSLSLDRFFHHIAPKEGEANFLDLQSNLASPLDLRIETNYKEADRIVEIKVHTSSMIALDNVNDRFKISLVLTEDNITGTSREFNQANFFSNRADPFLESSTIDWTALPNPVPASEMVYNKVLRAMLSPYYGAEESLPPFFETGQTYTYTTTYQIPEAFDPRSCNVIAILKDRSSIAAINVIAAPVVSTTTALHELGQHILELYPNPVQDELVVKQDGLQPLHFKLFSVGGQTMQQGLFPASYNVLNMSTLPKGIYFLEVWNNDTQERIIEKIEKF